MRQYATLETQYAYTARFTHGYLGSCSRHARHRCTRAGRQRPDSWQLHSGSLLRLLKRMLTLFPMQRLPSYRNDAYE